MNEDKCNSNELRSVGSKDSIGSAANEVYSNPGIDSALSEWKSRKEENRRERVISELEELENGMSS